MSEIKVNKISPIGTAFQFGESGDTITVPAGATILNSGTATNFGDTLPAYGADGNVLTSTGSAWASEAAAASGLTNGSNVVSTTITDARTQTATSTWTDIASGGFQTSITPSATTSDILVMLNMCSSNGGDHHFFRVVRDGSAITGGFGDSAGNRASSLTEEYYTGTSNNQHRGSASWFVDASISTTSAVTYKVQLLGGSSAHINRGGNDSNTNVTSRSISTLTLIELL
jgi:hypothetical protein